jgi:hypothetical protein
VWVIWLVGGGFFVVCLLIAGLVGYGRYLDNRYETRIAGIWEVDTEAYGRGGPPSGFRGFRLELDRKTKQFVMSYQLLGQMKGTWSVIRLGSSGDEVAVDAKTTDDLMTAYRVNGLDGSDHQSFIVRVIDADHVELLLGRDEGSRVRLRRAGSPGGDLPSPNSPVSVENYEKLALGMTLQDVRKILGEETPATADDVRAAYGLAPRPADDAAVAEWQPKVAGGTAFAWRNGKYRVVLAFTESKHSYQRVQAAVAALPRGDSTYFDTKGSVARVMPEVLPRPEVTVTAAELAGAYAANPAAADAKYKEKRVLVDGVVTGVMPPSNGQGSGQVWLVGVTKPDKSWVEVHCRFEEEEIGKVRHASKGQRLKINGICSGCSSGVYVECWDCFLVEAGPDPTVAVKAFDLAREYDRDQRAADDKYKGKLLSVSGGVAEVLPGPVIVLNPPPGTLKPVQVAAAPPADHLNWKYMFRDVKPGDWVTVQGTCAGLADGSVTLTDSILKR